MSFAGETKAELARLPGEPCCRRAELAALLRWGAALHREGRQFSLQITTEVPAVARRLIRLTHALLGTQPEVLAGPIRLRRGHRYLLKIPIDPESGLLEELGLLPLEGEKAAIPLVLIRRRCCRRAYLRGAFLARGTMADPERTYHLEVASGERELVRALQELLRRVGIGARRGRRGENHYLYLKDVGLIARFLSLIGADTARLALEEKLVRTGLRNEVNRLVNAETANLNKSIETGLAQAEALQALARAPGGLAQLPPKLREVAELRLAHPELSLQELGRRLSPPLSKSGVNHRLRELMRRAEAVKFL